MSGDPSRKAYPGRCLADGTCIKKQLDGAQIGLPGAYAAALCDGVRIRTRSCPQSSEAEHTLIVGVNIVWLLNAAATPFPRLSKPSAAHMAPANFQSS
jgi:hypothetical protein